MIFSRPEKMYQVHIYGMKKNRELIMHEMQKQGAVHVREVKKPVSGETFRKKEDAIIHDAVMNTERIERMKSLFSNNGSFLSQMFEEKHSTFRLTGYSDNAFRFWSNKCVLRIYKEYENIVSMERQYISDTELIKKSMRTLSHFVNFKGGLEALGEGKYSFSGLGKTTALKNKAQKQLYIEKISVSEDNEQYVFFSVPLEKKEVLEKTIHVFNITETGTVTDALTKKEEQLKSIKNSRKILDKKKKAFEKHKPLLLAIEERWQNIKAREAAAKNLDETEHTVSLEGWVPKSALEATTALQGAVVYFSEEKEFAPTKLKNPRLAEPYELITRNYSLPKYKDVDPTVFVAIAFTLFFGFMFMDIAYSILLFAVSVTLIRRGTKPIKDIGHILLLGSVSGAMFGVLSGSIFGNLVSFGSYFNVFTRPFSLITFSIMIGVVHINLGILTRLCESMRNKNHALLKDSLSWVGLESGAALLVAAVLLQQKYLAIPAAFLVLSAVAFRAREGVVGVIKSIDFFSNFLSYLRLMALAVVTGWLAFAVNLVAKLVSDVSLVFAAFLFTAGHLANFMLNIVSSGMHALRLNYVEFFGTFYDGGGVEYIPLVSKNKFHKTI